MFHNHSLWSLSSLAGCTLVQKHPAVSLMALVLAISSMTRMDLHRYQWACSWMRFKLPRSLDWTKLVTESFPIWEPAAKFRLRRVQTSFYSSPRTQRYEYRNLYIEIFFRIISEQNDVSNLLLSAGVFGIFFYIVNLPWP